MRFAHFKRITAAWLLLLCLSACTDGSAATDTTEPVTGTAVTTAALTSAVAETTAGADAELTSGLTGEEITSDTDAAQSELLTRISVLRSSKAESLFSSDFCPEAVYTSRTSDLASLYGFAFDETASDDAVNAVKNSQLSGDNYDMLLLRATDEAVSLMCSGLLENLSAAGIGITASSACAVSSLTSDFEYAGRVYMLPHTGLVSRVASAYVLSLGDGQSAVAAAVVRAWADRSYCFEKLAEILQEQSYEDEYCCIGCGDSSSAALALLTSAGGKIMLPGSGSSSSVPADNLSSADFAKAYNKAVQISAYLTEDENDIEIKKISELTASSSVAPLPPAEAGGEYITPVDLGGLTVVCAPAGIIDGSRLASALAALGSCSETVIMHSLVTDGADYDHSPLTSFVLENMHAEPAQLYSWGDFLDLGVNSLVSCKSLDSLRSDSKLASRRKVASQAAAIVLSRLK